MKQPFKVYTVLQQDDGYGGFEEALSTTHEGLGYLDLISGSNQSSIQDADIEESSHVIITDYFDGFENVIKHNHKAEMSNKKFEIIYVDNPVGWNHHLEIYLQFLGDI